MELFVLVATRTVGGKSCGVLDAKKTVAKHQHNYILIVTTANFQNESRSHDQLKLVRPNFKSIKNIL
jgi:hypothetical protein